MYEACKSVVTTEYIYSVNTDVQSAKSLVFSTPKINKFQDRQKQQLIATPASKG